MAVLEIRRRTGWLFVAVVLGHIVLISAQAKTGRGASYLETVVSGAFGEVQRVASSGVGGLKGAWENYVAVQQIRRRNEALADEVAQLRIALQRERTLAEQSKGLQELLDLRQELPLETVAARVIGGAANPAFRTMTIDKGAEEGLGPDMAVIVPAGVVGRIVQVSARSAKVQLLIDADAAAGAQVERTRAQGVVVGTGSGLKLEYVTGSADVAVGDRVVTSGIEGIFPATIDGEYPRGFLIGHIESLRRGPGRYEDAVVRPAVDFSALETVLVVQTRPWGDAIESASREDGGAPTAQDERR